MSERWSPVSRRLTASRSGTDAHGGVVASIIRWIERYETHPDFGPGALLLAPWRGGEGPHQKCDHASHNSENETF